MRFKFSLEAVLRVASIREDVEWAKLRAMQVSMSSISGALRQVVGAQITARRQRRADEHTCAAWLQASEVFLERMRDRERELTRSLEQQKQLVNEQRRLYLQARQKADALRKLRSTRREEFRREVERIEQIAVDDVFLNRYR